ncbi:hypothetical protein Tc00.1047053465323.20 [Trypanosoma cruzi]|uniref:Uncharacterized protein n=1 Tax=Trypanosoma cruzi (strain CL Brener) TaxID=353153 RepID=Q4CKY1_TRYCC|nr:hypothetical protein Tc00.1047053465323.20 [Trypanosoma cruzi]EAN80933.1 hypothetical protein Tc00.1047053465323.20 [Trypanosoma cruzi]|eukprot:XP_802379.1 hypothetical protein [Trypanosoma cruzi strain CL Brener]
MQSMHLRLKHPNDCLLQAPVVPLDIRAQSLLQSRSLEIIDRLRPVQQNREKHGQCPCDSQNRRQKEVQRRKRHRKKKEALEELPPTAAEEEAPADPSEPPPKSPPHSALPSSTEVPATMKPTEDLQKRH